MALKERDFFNNQNETRTDHDLRQEVRHPVPTLAGFSPT
jgi:hypothetical protein